MWEKIKNQLKWESIKRHKWYWMGGVLVLLLVVVPGIFALTDGVKRTVVAVEKRDLAQVVSVTGNVEPAQSVDLSFEMSGQVASVYAKAGRRVSAGTVLATLRAGDLAANWSSAKAQLDSQIARLAELERGARPEELAIKRTAVDQAQQNLQEAYDTVSDTINDTYTSADVAINGNTSFLYAGLRGVRRELLFTTSNALLENELSLIREEVEGVMGEWKSKVSGINSATDFTTLDTALREAQSNLLTVREYTRVVASIVEYAIVTDSVKATYRTSASTAVSGVNSAIATINAKIQSINAQKMALQRAQNDLTYTYAGNSQEQIDYQQALVRQAQANMYGLGAQLAKSRIIAPISGVIGKVDVKLGELSSPSKPVITLLSDSDFQVKINLPETDLAKVQIGNSAEITLDAYGKEVVFGAQVVAINSAATMINGTPTYQVTVQFNENDERVKDGLTANIRIITEKKEQVLSVPKSAVIYTKDGKPQVVKRDGHKKPTKITVGVGMSSEDGYLEITSGLNEGDKIEQTI